MNWQPCEAKQWMIYLLPHHVNECEQSLINCKSCLLGKQAVRWIVEHITELLTPIIGKNIKYRRKSTHSKIHHIANCNPCKTSLLDVKYVILIRYYFQTAKQENYMTLQIDLLDNPLTIYLIQTVLEISSKLYPDCRFRWGENLDCQGQNSSVPTMTSTRIDGPQPFCTLSWFLTTSAIHHIILFFLVIELLDTVSSTWLLAVFVSGPT